MRSLTLVQAKPKTTSQPIFCLVADTFWTRMRGLLGRSPQWIAQQSLLITDCSNVHSWGMRFAIDVVFLERDVERKVFLVTRIVRGFGPNTLLPCFKMGATDTLELSSGQADRLGLAEGDELCIA